MQQGEEESWFYWSLFPEQMLYVQVMAYYVCPRPQKVFIGSISAQAR